MIVRRGKDWKTLTCPKEGWNSYVNNRKEKANPTKECTTNSPLGSIQITSNIKLLECVLLKPIPLVVKSLT